MADLAYARGATWESREPPRETIGEPTRKPTEAPLYQGAYKDPVLLGSLRGGLQGHPTRGSTGEPTQEPTG